MAAVMWNTVKVIWCPGIQAEAHLMERRVYPGDVLPDLLPPRVTARKCSSGTECNLAGHPCRWAYTNPEHDPFDLADSPRAIL